MKLSKHIQENRKKINLSQEELAQKLFVSRQTISNWENNKSYPDIQNILLMSDIFKVSLDQLVRGDIKIMKKELANIEMNKYTKIMYIFLTLSMLSIGPSFLLPKYWFFLPPLFFGIIAIYASIKIDKIKKNINIKTYREIIAYMNDEDIELVKKTQNKNKNIKFHLLIILVFLITSMFLAFLSIYLFNVLLNR